MGLLNNVVLSMCFYENLPKVQLKTKQQTIHKLVILHETTTVETPSCNG